MKYSILFTMFFMIGCSHSSTIIEKEKISMVQELWQSKDPTLAKKLFPEIVKLEESGDEYTLGTGEPGLPLFGIRVRKKSSTISRISLWLTEKGKDNVAYIKKTLVTDDWVSTPVQSKSPHVIENKVSHHSKKLGVSFIFDEYDPQRRIWVIYWGADPKKINL